MKRRGSILVGPLAALVLAGAACQSSGDIHTPVGDVAWVTGNGKYLASGNLPPGYCLEITFLDASGQPIGEPIIVTPPESSDVPAGTRNFRTRLVTDCDGSPQAGIGGSIGASVFGGLETFEFAGGPIDPYDGAITFAMAVTAADLATAIQIRDDVLANLTSSPPPPSVDVHYLMTYGLIGSDAVFSLAEDDTWLDCDLELNDVVLATITEADRQSVNGWDVLTYAVPSTAFDYDPTGSWSNEVRFEFDTDTEGPLEATFEVDSTDLP